MDTLELFCNGNKFSGFNSVNVVRSLDQIAATYSLSVFQDYSDASMIVPIFPDDEVRLEVDGDVLLEGYNETTQAGLSSSAVNCTISGKEYTADLVKCPCAELVYENKKVDEIVRRICSGFGLNFRSVSGVDLGAPLKSIAANPSTKAFDVMVQACKERRVFPVSDGRGNVSINNNQYESAEVSLVQGKNILSVQGNFSNVARYSKYRVISANDPKGKTYAEVLDDQMTRQREWVLMDSQFSSKENCEARARWEANHRQAESNGLSIVVGSWRQKQGGSLWVPGLLVTADVPAFGIDDQFLINRVTYTYGQDGVRAVLQLVNPDLYVQAPAFAKKSKKMKKDIWASVRAQTGSKLR